MTWGRRLRCRGSKSEPGRGHRCRQAAGSHATADQPAGLDYRADDERCSERDCDDPRQDRSEPIFGDPTPPERLGVNHELQRDADDDECRGHHERADDDFPGDRQGALRRKVTGRAVSANPVCTAHAANAMPAPWRPARK